MKNTDHSSNSPGTLQWATVLFFVALFLGLLLRVIFPSDMEWKNDEVWMFYASQTLSFFKNFSTLGMESGAGIQNPGFSLWPFMGFAQFSSTPVGMVQWVQWLNVLAILGALIAAFKLFQGEIKTLWMKTLLLMSVSPLPVLFSRKLWAQCVLPPLMFLFFFSYRKRMTQVGAFFWGFLGLVIGQIHLSGFFFTASVFLSFLIIERKNLRETKWGAWVFGNFLSLLLMIPWMQEAITHLGGGTVSRSGSWANLFKLKYFAHWLGTASGVYLRQAFKSEFSTFMKEPVFFGVPTGLVGLFHLVLIGIFGFLFFKWLSAIFFKKTGKAYTEKLDSDHRVFLIASGLVLGGFFSFLRLNVHGHYLIVAYPWMFFWLVLLFQGRKRLFSLFISANLFVSLYFVGYVHIEGGIPEGDYGVSYRLKENWPILDHPLPEFKEYRKE